MSYKHQLQSDIYIKSSSLMVLSSIYVLFFSDASASALGFGFFRLLRAPSSPLCLSIFISSALCPFAWLLPLSI